MLDNENSNETMNQNHEMQTEQMNQQSVENNNDNAKHEKTVQEQLAEQKEHYLRIIADYENRMKRASNDAMHSIANTIEKLLSDLIPLIGDISQASTIIEGDAKTGIELIVKNMKNIFSKYGIHEIVPTIGEDFDTNKHQAINSIADPNYSEDKILQVLQTGYSFNNRIIIPAMVIISQ